MIATLLFLALLDPAPPADFDARFTGRTLRFDYVHTGTASEEHVAYQKLRLEGDWPGSRTQLVDGSETGKYLFEVLELKGEEVKGEEAKGEHAIFSRGFSSIYGEWETTGEAKERTGAFQESQRFPEPRTSVQLRLSKRGTDGRFHSLFTTTIDPTGRFVDRAPITPRGDVLPIFENG